MASASGFQWSLSSWIDVQTFILLLLTSLKFKIIKSIEFKELPPLLAYEHYKRIYVRSNVLLENFLYIFENSLLNVGVDFVTSVGLPLTKSLIRDFISCPLLQLTKAIEKANKC